MRLSPTCLVTAALIVSLSLTVCVVPRPALALDSDTRAVLTTSAYGMVGGTVLGLVSLPFTQNARSVFIGTSVGLYLGIVVGIYHISHRYDPENPLHQEYPQNPPQTTLDQGQGIVMKPGDAPPALARFEYPVARF